MDYAEHKVSEALRLAGGNEAKARRQIHAWFYEDPKLLLELTRPHWNGIVAYAVDRAVARALKGENIDVRPASPRKSGSAKAQEGFGKEILKSFVAEHAAQFGREQASAPVSKRAASQNHVDAIHLIAAKSKKKK
ncbi:MAG TPA: hypothetical protein VIN59_03765 [Alphaproteobacteria bacterium]